MKTVIFTFLFALALNAAAQAPNPAEFPPVPPPAPSPLEKFRSWLIMPEAEREQALAAYSPEKQKVLREKLAAYQILPREQRERRLNMLELRWYLRPLMAMAPEERTAHLKAVPPPLQPMVMDRLLAWDKLDARTRGELLASEDRRELVMAYFGQIRRGIPQNVIFNAMPEARRDQLQIAIAAWNKTPPAELQRKAEHLATFYDTLAPDTQAKALAVLSPAEKAEVQQTLDAFSQLPVAQRRACINSFQKFATMSAEERSQFLRNAARWREMTPKERETWKQLVTSLPPMPPEPEAPAPPMPGRAETATGSKQFAETGSISLPDGFPSR